MSSDPIAAVISSTVENAPAQQSKINYGFSMQDINRFENAYDKATNNVSSLESTQSTQALQKVLSPLINLNKHSEELKVEAESAISDDVKPGELMMLTMRAHEFMFHCELTANVANRSSDGVQQLFRQQS